jgi:hypothetical protein
MAFHLSWLALGLASATGVVTLRAFAAAQAKQCAALRAVRIASPDRRMGRRSDRETRRG